MQDISKLGLDDLRSKLTVMPQVGWLCKDDACMTVDLSRILCCFQGACGRIWTRLACMWDTMSNDGSSESDICVCSYDDQKLWRALEVSHLKETVSKLDGKLEGRVSEGGESVCMAVCVVESSLGLMGCRGELQCWAATADVPCAGGAAQDEDSCA